MRRSWSARWATVGFLVVALAGCGSSPVPVPSGSTASGSPSEPPASAAVASTTVHASDPVASSGTAPAPTASSSASIAEGRILFTRHSPATDDVFCYRINPDGSGEAPWAWCGPQSPDGTTILASFATPNGFGPFLHGRPATVNVDGTGIRVLDAYPDRAISLFCSAWSPDGRRLLCESGFDLKPGDDGVYTVRAADGGDLRRLTSAPAKHEDQPWGYSPDGARILFFRMSDEEPSVVYSVNTDGSGLRRLSSTDLSASDDDRPAAWSPDGSRIAFSAARTDTGLRSLFIVNSDGSGLREISPADVGGVDAQWSPDGQWIAFNSRICCEPQIWIVHPDGTGAEQLTNGADGSISLSPIWSPDGSKLLFHRVRSDQDTLWTTAADGSGPTQIAAAGEGFDLGGYWWSVPAGS